MRPRRRWMHSFSITQLTNYSITKFFHQILSDQFHHGFPANDRLAVMQYSHLTESLAQFIGLQQEFRVARSFVKLQLGDGVGLVNETAAGFQRRQNSREELTTQI